MKRVRNRGGKKKKKSKQILLSNDRVLFFIQISVPPFRAYLVKCVRSNVHIRVLGCMSVGDIEWHRLTILWYFCWIFRWLCAKASLKTRIQSIGELSLISRIYVANKDEAAWRRCVLPVFYIFRRHGGFFFKTDISVYECVISFLCERFQYWIRCDSFEINEMETFRIFFGFLFAKYLLMRMSCL